MSISEWYLKVDRLPEFSQDVENYLLSLKPFKATYWDLTSSEMKEYQRDLLKQLIEIQRNRCAYCGLGLDRNLVDREHFVHKAQAGGRPEFMFHPQNLFAACAFCNRRLKGQRATLKVYCEDYTKCEFHIVHPFLDEPSNELLFVANKKGHHVLAKAVTPKGKATIDFFKLDEKIMTCKRVGYIAECEAMEEMSKEDYAEIKSISYYKPE